MSGNAEKGANAARQGAADGGSAVERQKLEHAGKKMRLPMPPDDRRAGET
jgi:hypothetical protein